MDSSVIAVFIFWCSFGFSIGPFWISIMQAVNENGFKVVFYHYLIYQIVGWLPAVLTASFITAYVGGLNEYLFIFLHIVGMSYVLYFAYKILRSKVSQIKTFKFEVKQMVTLNWSNPKFWAMVPMGMLVSNFSDSIAINVAYFYLIGLPIYFVAFFFWAGIGIVGRKAPLRIISTINASLLFLFALYLGYQGWQLSQII